MSEGHGPVRLRPLSEVAEYLKKIIPVNIPQAYALKPMFLSIAGEERIRDGVIAFRDFLRLLCERLITDGSAFDKPPAKPKNDLDYPFLHSISSLLIDIGCYSRLSEDGGALLVSEAPSFAVLSKDKSKTGKYRLPINCLRFLELCGFVFTGINFDGKAVALSSEHPLTVAYPQNPALLTGLKALGTADVKLRERRYNTDASVFRCDYKLLKAEATDPRDALIDFLAPLPQSVRNFALDLHERYTKMGMTCETLMTAFDNHIFYSNLKNTRRALSARDKYYLRVWEFALSVRHGCRLVVRDKNTYARADVIENFKLPLRAIIERGYGCDRRLRNEPCQHGCQGFRIPLDESIVELGGDIKIWLDRLVHV
jgi:hypothetical protein